MRHWTDNIKKKECSHILPANGRENPPSAVTDFSYYEGDNDEKTKHHYCALCRGHWWQGRFWTAKEWNDYVNGVELGK